MNEPTPNRRYPAVGFIVTGMFAVFVVWVTFGDPLVATSNPPVDRVTTGSLN